MEDMLIACSFLKGDLKVWFEGASGLKQFEFNWLELAAEADLAARYS